jgi:hypothetical protein
MALSPSYAQDGTLMISAKGEGLLRSKDAGQSFEVVGSALIASNHLIKLIEFSPTYAQDNTVYVASDLGLFRSVDEGETWKAMTRPIRNEDRKDIIQYEGDWQTLRDDAFSAGSIAVSEAAHSEAALGFTGTGVIWIGTQGPEQGMARVYVDGNYAGEVDQFSDAPRALVNSFSVAGLPRGTHRIVVEVSDTKNPNSSGYRVSMDAFDVIP